MPPQAIVSRCAALSSNRCRTCRDMNNHPSRRTNHLVRTANRARHPPPTCFLTGCCRDRDSVASQRAPKPNLGATPTQAASRRDGPRGSGDVDPKDVPRPLGTIGVRAPHEGRAVSDAAESGAGLPREVGLVLALVAFARLLASLLCALGLIFLRDGRSTARGQSGRRILRQKARIHHAPLVGAEPRPPKGQDGFLFVVMREPGRRTKR